MDRIETIVLACMFIAIPADAFAYLDPGTGSYVLQLIIGGVVGALLGVKMFWKTIKDKVSSWFKKDR
jgi:uncharacterized membrane protein YqgA involved in biofilm formation